MAFSNLVFHGCFARTAKVEKEIVPLLFVVEEITEDHEKADPDGVPQVHVVRVVGKYELRQEHVQDTKEEGHLCVRNTQR